MRFVGKIGYGGIEGKKTSEMEVGNWEIWRDSGSLEFGSIAGSGSWNWGWNLGSFGKMEGKIFGSILQAGLD